MASGYSRLGGDDAGGGRRGGRGGGQRSYGTNDPDVGFAPSEGNSTEFFQVMKSVNRFASVCVYLFICIFYREAFFLSLARSTEEMDFVFLLMYM